MAELIQQNDYDYLARKMGFRDMQDVHHQRVAEEEEARKAKMEAEAKAMEEELIKREREEEAEVAEALKQRMKVKVDGKVLKGPKGSDRFQCPMCSKAFPFARETLLLAARRSCFQTEDWFPQWHAYTGIPGNRNDFIPAGPDTLIMRLPSMIFSGRGKCACGHTTEIEIFVECMHDGEKVNRFVEE